MISKRIAGVLSAGLLALSVSACGFTPMYGAQGVASELEDVRVLTGQERADFYLQEALYDRLGSRNAEGPLELRTETEVNSIGLGVGADAIASRFAVEVRVDYALYEPGASDPVVQGSVTGQASYNVPRDIYATVAAERDAEERAAGMAADRIINQLARALQNRDAW